MQRVLNWLRGKALPTSEKNTAPPSAQWEALNKAMCAHDFNAVSVNLRAWCMLPEHDLERLRNAAVLAAFSPAEVTKLEILFEYYADHMVSAFARAQDYLDSHGFDPDLHVISLVCLYQNNQFEDALAYARKLPPDETARMNRADYWQLVSVIRWAANDMDSLQQAADRAIELAPDDGAILQTALGMYIELGIQDKVDWVRARLADRPDAQGYAHSLSLLALGEHAQGWQQMEGRYDIHDAHRYLNQGLKPFPRWQGESLTGRRLLISAEQGLGDTVQMARYLPVLRQTGVEEVVMEAQPEALTLLQYNFPDMQIVERLWAQAPAVGFDCWTGMMSLPFLLQTWGPHTPGRSGYLRVPPENGQYWEERVKQLGRAGRRRIGLAWSGQPSHRADRRRSIPFALMMQQVRRVDADFFALQTVVPEVLPSNVHNVSEEMITLADTAALIAQMDLVITVDTSVVHIAGALGKETWLLLPKRYEWRWGLEGETNEWYDAVTVIRQTAHANWGPVLQDVFERRLHGKMEL